MDNPSASLCTAYASWQQLCQHSLAVRLGGVDPASIGLRHFVTSTNRIHMNRIHAYATGGHGARHIQRASVEACVRAG